VAVVVLIWGLASTAICTSGADNLMKRPAHCTSQVVHFTSSCAVTVNLLMSHFVTCNTKPFPSTYPSLIHVPISLKYHSHITSSLISIHNLSWIFQLCSSEKYLLRGHCMVAREISLFGLNYFISPATCKFPFACLALANLTFRGPCIVIYSYNESQRDALFLKFIW